MTNVYFNEDNLTKVLDSMCECGHKLSYHGFVDGTCYPNDKFLWVSQCCFCDYDDEKDEFGCKEFRQAAALEDDK